MITESRAPTRIDPENPWPGLDSFTEEAQRYFHGRSRETAELLRLVRRETLTLLYGHSGLGKSSLLMAGLFPQLRTADLLPVYARIDHDPAAPRRSDQLLQQLLETCRAQGITAPPVPSGESLWGYLHRTDTIFWTARSRPVVPVFVIDQFEEVFTLGRQDPRASAEFLQDLTDLVHNNPPRQLVRRLDEAPDEGAAYAFPRTAYKLVLAMREDFFPHFRSFGKQFRYGEYRLQPMHGGQALEAVRETGGRLVDEPVAREIIRFLSGGRAVSEGDEPSMPQLEIEPALLSVVCSELNEKRKALRRPRIEPELLQGSQEAILLDFYARVTADLDPRVRRFVQEKLISESGFRNSFPVSDAERIPGVTPEALAFLVNQRLLRVEERSGTRRVELTHDVLTGVVQEFRDRDRRAEELEVLRREQAIARAKQRRARALTLVFVVLFLGASGLAGWALMLRQQASAQALRATEAWERAERANAERERALGQAREAAAGRERALLEAQAALAETRRANEEATRANAELVRSNHATNEALRRALIEEDRSDRLLRQERRIQMRSEAQDTVAQMYLRRMQSLLTQAAASEEEMRSVRQRADSYQAAFCQALQQASGAGVLVALRDSVARQIRRERDEVCPEPAPGQ